MQMNYVNEEELVALLEDSQILSIVDNDQVGLRTWVLTYAGFDVLAFGGLGNGAAIVYPCEAFDRESGGSVHDHARAIYVAA